MTEAIRTVSLITPKKPLRWAGIRNVSMLLCRFLLMMAASLALAVAIALALGSWQLGENSLFLYILGIGVLVVAYWYFDIRRSSLRRRRSMNYVLERANSPANGLVFTNGQNGDFTPTGAIQLMQGGIAVGIDPKSQLARYVQLNPLRDELWIDNVFGLEMAPQIVILDTPMRNLANSLRKMFGRPFKKMAVLRLSNGADQIVDFRIYPGHIAKARELVRQIDIRRSNLTPNAS